MFIARNIEYNGRTPLGVQYLNFVGSTNGPF